MHKSMESIVDLYNYMKSEFLYTIRIYSYILCMQASFNLSIGGPYIFDSVMFLADGLAPQLTDSHHHVLHIM